MKIYYIFSDNGDGSVSASWYKNRLAAEVALEDDDECERYGCNEGQVSSITLPDDLDLKTTGIYFDDEEE